MSSRLEYSLGLATGSFLGPLGAANAGLAAFSVTAGALGGVLAGVFNEINRGGNLKDLSNRTAETVGDLFQLQFAFEQSGIAASSVAPILQKYRAALSGVGEMGESTAEAFTLIGTSLEELRGMNAPQALQAIFAGLNGLDRNTAAGVAGKIFGRGQAGEILQLARDAKDFAGALGESAAQAALFQRSADAFDRIGDALGEIKLQLRGVFAAIAEDITPALNVMLQALKTGDFATLGEVARLSLTIGFGEAVNFLAKGLQAVFLSIPDMMGAAISAFSSIGDTIVAGLLDAWATFLTVTTQNLPVGSGLREEIASSAALAGQTADAMREEAANGIKGSVAAVAAGIKTAITADTSGIIDTAATRQALAALTTIGQAVAASPRGPGGLSANNVLTSSTKTLGDANALERIGALFGGGSSSSLADSSRQTAANTRESSKTLYKVSATLEKMAAQNAGGFANV